MTNQENSPVYIMSDDAKRTVGKTAQRNNILAAKLVAETVRTTLGPKGMDKMLVDSVGEIIVTNDGVTILEEMQIEHPAAKMIVEVAKTQENEIGDGTTTAVVLAGQLLKNAEGLLDKDIHPTVIAKGYRLAAAEVHKVLNEVAGEVGNNDDRLLKNIAATAMTGKGAEVAKEHLASVVVKSVKQMRDERGEVEVDNIKLEKKTGGAIEDTELVQGIILDKERVHNAMPRVVEGARIALLDVPLEVKSLETDAKVEISDASKMREFFDMEEGMLKEMADRIIISGANVVLCQKGVEDMVQHFLAKKGIFACRRIKKSDMDKLARATGGKVVSKLEDLGKDDLGFASVVEEKKIGDEEMTFVTGCRKARAVTILVRGGTEHIVDEAERAVKDAIGDVAAVLKDEKAVGGAGAVEIIISERLRKFAEKLSGRERLAVQEFANAVDVIPETLAENSGLDPIDSLTAMKASYAKGQTWNGLDVFSGKVMDSWKKGVIEPLKIKTQAINSAAEVAEMILRIDDVLLSGKVESRPMPHEGM
jgi:archaeal chaperonin